MTALIAGLVLFLGIHSARMLAPTAREGLRARLGEGGYKGLYSLISVAGFALLIWGYGEARLTPTLLWDPPVWTRHLAATLMLPAMILLTAAYVPGTNIKARVGHPMVLGVKTWAVAHLLANGTLADLLLFGGFLAWGVVNYIASRRRDRAEGKTYPALGASRDAIAAAIGIALWAALVFGLHAVLFGVSPLG